ncbi:unnamed protein product [Urochloa humidicola]
MELSPLLVAFLAMTLATIIILCKCRATHRGHKVYNLPPGPSPWPVMGNLNLLGTLPHRSIQELSKKHGPLMLLRFGSFPVVVGSSVDMARFFLKTHDVLFLDRPRTAAGKHTTYDYSDITWLHYGPRWIQARRICATELFSTRRIASSKHIRADEVRALVRGLFAAAEPGVPVHLNKDHLFPIGMNMVTRIVLGKRFFGEGVDAVAGPVWSVAELKWMLDELMQLNGVVNVGDWVPWLGWADLQGYVRRMKKVGRKLNAFMEHVIDEHGERRRREGEGFVAKDLLDVLMDPTLDLEVTHVKGFTQDLISGGTEGGTATVDWAMSELLRKPTVLATATEELDRVVGRGRWVAEEDLPRLPFLQAIVKETMRLHPVSPLLSPRVAREDASIAGYDIPRGTLVHVNVWAIGRDPAVWDAPDEFVPERFIGSEVDVVGQDLELLPFGSGRRMCPGYSLGLKMVQLSLANMLHDFTWRLPEGMKEEDITMEEVFGLTTARKFPLEVLVRPRLPAQLYA